MSEETKSPGAEMKAYRLLKMHFLRGQRVDAGAVVLLAPHEVGRHMVLVDEEPTLALLAQPEPLEATPAPTTPVNDTHQGVESDAPKTLLDASQGNRRKASDR